MSIVDSGQWPTSWPTFTATEPSPIKVRVKIGPVEVTTITPHEPDMGFNDVLLKTKHTAIAAYREMQDAKKY